MTTWPKNVLKPTQYYCQRCLLVVSIRPKVFDVRLSNLIDNLII